MRFFLQRLPTELLKPFLRVNVADRPGTPGVLPRHSTEKTGKSRSSSAPTLAHTKDPIRASTKGSRAESALTTAQTVGLKPAMAAPAPGFSAHAQTSAAVPAPTAVVPATLSPLPSVLDALAPASVPQEGTVNFQPLAPALPPLALQSAEPAAPALHSDCGQAMQVASLPASPLQTALSSPLNCSVPSNAQHKSRRAWTPSLTPDRVVFSPPPLSPTSSYADSHHHAHRPTRDHYYRSPRHSPRCYRAHYSRSLSRYSMRSISSRSSRPSRYSRRYGTPKLYYPRYSPGVIPS